jgi:hypothetical protein
VGIGVMGLRLHLTGLGTFVLGPVG